MTSRCSRPARGISLVEVLLTFAVMSTMLAIVAGLAQEFAEVSRYVSARDKAAVGTHMAVERVKAELLCAVDLLAPSSDVPEPELRFHKVDPTTQARLPLEGASPPSWDPHDPSYLVEVRYRISGRNLLRTLTPAAGPARTQVVAEGLEGFSCSRLPDGAVQIRASFAEDRYLRVVTTRLRPRAL